MGVFLFFKRSKWISFFLIKIQVYQKSFLKKINCQVKTMNTGAKNYKDQDFIPDAI